VIATLRVLSALLSYPGPELAAAAAEMEEALAGEELLDGREREGIAALIAEIAGGDPYELQERYVDLFDRSRSLSLHLFEHVYGESRDRGAMMVDLVERYRVHGLEIAVKELPDYLPLYLEYLSLLPLEQARRELAEPVAVLASLARRLEKRRSAYAPVLAALERIAAAEPDARHLRQLEVEEQLDAEGPAALDRQWQEDPVTFGGAEGHRRARGALAGGTLRPREEGAT
jgi:nitrate reductase molybdenum cofactor assembly chaperone NarJ/NarW